MSRVAFIVAFLFVHFVATAQPFGTVQDGMKAISDRYGVYFVYEASLPVTHSFPGQSLKGKHLKDALDTLFENTGIKWLRKGKYILLKASIEDQLSPSIDLFQLDTLPAASISEIIKLDINNTQAGLTTIDGDKFKSAFACLSSPDVLKTLQSLPGVATGTEMLSRLYVHGGDGSDNLYLLDGVPLYQVCHFGGILSSFNTDVIDNLDFFKSGFPARYGGRTSSVVDVKTREGSFTQFKGQASVGLLEGRIQLEGPIVRDKTSFNIALRRSWADALMYPISQLRNLKQSASGTLERSMLLYSFTDVNAKITHRLSDHNQLSASFFMGRDHLIRNYNSVEEDTKEPVIYKINENNSLRMIWGNILASINWRKDWSPKFNSIVMGYWSASHPDIRYHWKEEGFYKYYESREEIENKTELINRNTVDDVGVGAYFKWRPVKDHQIRFGANMQGHLFWPTYDYYESRVNTGTPLFDVCQQDTVKTFCVEGSVYVEDELIITRRLKANIGFRNILYLADRKQWNFLEPRIAIKYLWYDNLNLKVSYSKMSQFLHQMASTYLDLPTNCWLPSSSELPPMFSHQLSGGSYCSITEDVHINVEGWYKVMNNLIEYFGENSVLPRLNDWTSVIYSGKGRSYGVEVDCGYETPSLIINAFYTLSWNERNIESIYYGWYRDRNDNRHKLTLQANWRLNKKWELYGAWNFHSGNRMTLPTRYIQGVYADGDGSSNSFSYQWVYETPNNVKLPDYHRLDIGANIHGKTKRGQRYIWNISLYNTYCQFNPVFAVVSREGVSKSHPEYDPGYVAFKGIGTSFVPFFPSFSYKIYLNQ